MHSHGAIQRHKAAMHANQDRRPAAGDVFHALVFDSPIEIAEKTEDSARPEPDVVQIQTEIIEGWFGIRNLFTSTAKNPQGGEAGATGHKSEVALDLRVRDRPGIANGIEGF